MPDKETSIAQIHAQPGQLVLTTAGGGTAALADLCAISGASQTVLEAYVPYAKEAFIHFVGREPDKFVSWEGVRLLAGNALRRALRLRPHSPEPLFGVACSASLATLTPKRGGHQVLVAVWSLAGIRSYRLWLTQGARSRTEEERLASDLLLTAVGEAFSVPFPPLNLLPNETIEREEIDFAQAVRALLAGAVPYVAVSDHGRVRTSGLQPQTLLPGSFNPLHYGHKKLARVATTQLDRPVAFELAVTNVDKPPLTETEILRRLAQFAGRYPVYLTNTPRFVEKAWLFPQTTFVIGADTAVRLIQPHYYQDDENAMLTALEELAQANAHFLVAGREDATTTRFRELADIPIPPAYVHLFDAIPASHFRVPVSSTTLRTAEATLHPPTGTDIIPT